METSFQCNNTSVATSRLYIVFCVRRFRYRYDNVAEQRSPHFSLFHTFNIHGRYTTITLCDQWVSTEMRLFHLVHWNRSFSFRFSLFCVFLACRRWDWFRCDVAVLVTWRTHTCTHASNDSMEKYIPPFNHRMYANSEHGCLTSYKMRGASVCVKHGVFEWWAPLNIWLNLHMCVCVCGYAREQANERERGSRKVCSCQFQDSKGVFRAKIFNIHRTKRKNVELCAFGTACFLTYRENWILLAHAFDYCTKHGCSKTDCTIYIFFSIEATFQKHQARRFP